MPGYKLTAGGLARAMGLRDRAQMERIVREKQAITADTALRLARFFGATPAFWSNLQVAHDRSRAAINTRDELAAIKPLVAT